MSYLRDCRFSCRVSPSSLVGTWAAAVVWLSFRMSWMWNDSLSDAECHTSRISYPWKQMLVSHRGLLFWRKNNMRTCDVMCELEESYHLKIKKNSGNLHRNGQKKPRTNTLCCLQQCHYTICILWIEPVGMETSNRMRRSFRFFTAFWCVTWRTETEQEIQCAEQHFCDAFSLFGSV